MTERALKTDHVLVFHHRIDLVNLMEHFMNHDQVKPLEECVQILGFDGVLYKVVVAKLYPEFPDFGRRRRRARIAAALAYPTRCCISGQRQQAGFGCSTVRWTTFQNLR